MQRIYLDNAATSWPKPPAVYDAIDRYQREVGASAGRGAYDSASEAGGVVRAARSAVARLIGAPDASHVAFSSGGTESLNLAIQGVLRPGDHVVSTVCEHNAVLRPLALLGRSRGVRVDYVRCGEDGVVDPSEIAAAIRPDTRLVTLTSASNVTGAVQPIEEVGRICREREVLLLVDAAQSLGHLPVDVEASAISLLAAPAHKGMLGPMGVGVLYVAPGVEAQLQPLLVGGTGVDSQSASPPEQMPQRYEAGSLNVPSLAGLAAGLDWLQEHASERRANQSPAEMTQRLIDGLAAIEGVRLIGPPADATRAPVVCFSVDGYDPHDVTAVLATSGIECRAGLHCSPKMHQALGTAGDGGAIRLSPGIGTTAEQVDATLQVLASLACVV
ncbi:MAG: cysteine desulfurase [Planctomycetota bacterium]